MKRYILNLFLLVMLFSVSACSDDDLGPSIFNPSTEELTELDLWMQDNFTKPYNIEVLYKWLDIVGLDSSILNRYPHELSGGQQQRVGIARALAASPAILLMDEPFSAVDEITRTQLQKEMKEIHEKTKITVMFVTHDIREALYLADKVLVMQDGIIHQFDTPDEVLNHPATPFVEKLLERTKFILNK